MVVNIWARQQTLPYPKSHPQNNLPLPLAFLQYFIIEIWLSHASEASSKRRVAVDQTGHIEEENKRDLMKTQSQFVGDCELDLQSQKPHPEHNLYSFQKARSYTLRIFRLSVC